MMGIAFSLIPAVMVAFQLAYIVEEKRLGTAYALMTLISANRFLRPQSYVGMANDAAMEAEPIPEANAVGMWIFSTLGFLGRLCDHAWKTEAGPQGHGLEPIKASSK